ncbi:hypothetical protein OHT59_43285 [Streptomyces sp. NBC_00243]|uniref:hypothetical protein n=1 Tax=Streptomyces sp. NBC_00243 TaxID=2975688 RepID=UPI002DDB049B|nr:hypothetical protein [Streptomyces sp. NBC_00243]WRZ24869.1 hypothetical protein OHT59_43285 [Streptomyces sp. NBC_00243]
MSASRFARQRTPSIFAADNSSPSRAVISFACMPSTPSPSSASNSSTIFWYPGASDAAVMPSRRSGTLDLATGTLPTVDGASG